MKTLLRISAVLLFCLVIGLVSVTVAQAETIASGTYDRKFPWTLDSDGTLTISGNGELSESSTTPPWKSYSNDISAIVIGEGITEICDYLFSNCVNLTSVSIPSSVTYIDWDAFQKCDKLNAVYVSAGNSDFSDIDGVLFDADQAEIIRYPRGRSGAYAIPEGVTRIGIESFLNCCVTDVTIPSSVTSIGLHAFSGCRNLTDVVIPDSVTDISTAIFRDCVSLKSVEFPKNMTYIPDYTFDNCVGLTEFSIQDKVDFIDRYAFRNCTGLKSITFPRNMGYILDGAFEGCTALSTIYYRGHSHSWVEPVIYSGNDQFKKAEIVYCFSATSGDCNDLHWILDDEGTLTISGSGAIARPGNNADYPWKAYFYAIDTVLIEDGVTEIGEHAFSDCNYLSFVTIPSSVTVFGDSVFRNCTLLSEIELSNNLTVIPPYAFEGCKYMQQIRIPNKVVTIGSHAFHGCTELFIITLPRRLRSVCDYAFEGCAELSQVDFKGSQSLWNEISIDEGNEPLTGADFIFRPADMSGSLGDLKWTLDGLGTLTISGKGELLRPDDDADYPWTPYATDIESVIIEDGITVIGDSAFAYCYNLENATIPSSVTSIYSFAFFACKKLRAIEIPDSVTGIGFETFRFCTGLTSVRLSRNMTSLPSFAFEGCESLTELTLPENITLISNGVFRDCKSLTNITLPGCLYAIYDNAFVNCDALSKVYFHGTYRSWGDIYIEEGNECFQNAEVVFCPLSAEGTWGDLTWSLDSNGTLTLSGSGEMQSTWIYSEDGSSFCVVYADWHNYSSEILHVVIGSGITNIGYESFTGCRNLAKVTISDTVTTIDHFAFQNCTGLTEINIPLNVTRIQSSAFEGCNCLSTVNYGGTEQQWRAICLESNNDCLETATIHYYGSVLSDLILPASLEAVEEEAFAGGAFKCVKLSEHTTEIGPRAFAGCTELACIHIPASVTRIAQDAFDGVKNLAVFGKIDSAAEACAAEHGFLFFAE